MVKTSTPARRLARDLDAYRDVYVRKTSTMAGLARKIGVHRVYLHRRVAALPAELTDRIDRLERTSLS